MEKLSYKLPVFEGPLDLLLYLVAKNKVDICEISIVELVDQYLEQIHAMKEQDMDVASEFLAMAARLVYIKSVSLLPRHEQAEELKQELTGQLLEYRECRRAAEQLAARVQFDSFVRQPQEIEFDRVYRCHHTVEELLAAYRNAAGRGKRLLPPPAEAFSGIVAHRIVSVTSRIVHVLRRLWTSHSIRYAALFEEGQTRSDLVATFLAVLELIRGHRVRMEGGESDAVLELQNGGVKQWKSENSKAQ